MKTLIINSKNNGKKLNNVLLKEFPSLSINTLHKALRKKDIRVNDVRVSQNVQVYTGDIIKIYISDSLLFKEQLDSIQKVYEDENILIVNKPKNLEVTGENSLSTMLSSMYGFSIMPCHRLDRNTSGLTLFAKNELSLSILLEKFKNHEIEKHYRCRVYGIPKEKHKILKAFLFKDTKKSIVYISDSFKKGALPITTEYFVISSNSSDNTSILEVILHTGRTHQIRAHLAYTGFPIVGDGKYGINSVNKSLNCKAQDLTSYLIKFNFKTDAGILNYLKNMEIKLENKI